MKSTCALCGTTHAELVHARLILGSGMSTFDANLAMRGAIEPGRVLGDGNGRRPQQGGGKNAIRIFSHFPHFFSHFLGRSLSVMFKRIHSSGIV